MRYTVDENERTILLGYVINNSNEAKCEYFCNMASINVPQIEDLKNYNNKKKFEIYLWSCIDFILSIFKRQIE